MNQKIPSLNGLRALSIILVIGGHITMDRYNNNLVSKLGFFLFDGQLGVNIFFVISGFLITHLLLLDEGAGRPVSLKNFYLRRVLRIFPAYYFMLLVYGILQWTGFFHFNTTSWISSITYTKQFFPESDIQTAHLWSLSVEEFFYLLWPISFILFKKHRTTFALLVIVSTTIARYFQYQYPLPSHNNTIFCTADSLMIGCLIAIHHDRVATFVVKSRSWIFIVVPFLVFFIFLERYFYHLESAHFANPSTARLVALTQPVIYSLFGNIGLFTNLFIGVLIMASVHLRNRWYAFLNLNAMDFTGKLSYSIYLWQQLFTLGLSFWMKLPIPVILLLTFLTALISYYLIERPFLKLKGSLDKRGHKHTYAAAIPRQLLPEEGLP
jgi:peptidoglycan/LPS O-acetylase OafA/YrhL